MLKSEKSKRKISVERTSEEIMHDKIIYKIGQNKYEFPLLAKDAEYRGRRMHPRYVDIIREVRYSLDRLVNISWLSVHREILDEEFHSKRMPVLHISLHSPCMTSRFYVDIMDQLLSYISTIDGVKFTLPSKIKEGGEPKPGSSVGPYIRGINKTLIRSVLRR